MKEGQTQNLTPKQQLALLNPSLLCPRCQVLFFLVIAGFYALRIRTCFPANGSVTHILPWFYMLCPLGLTVPPHLGMNG